MVKSYKLIKAHGNYKKGEDIKLHPSTAEVFIKHGLISKPKAKKID